MHKKLFFRGLKSKKERKVLLGEKGRFMENLLERILQFFYPNVCGICGKIEKETICKQCQRQLETQIIAKRKSYIIREGRYFDEQIYLFQYKDMIRMKILSYKFNNQAYLYQTFAKLILNQEKICKFISKYEMLYPVPLHKIRRRQRGYNQSELIGKEISRKLGIPFSSKNLVKIKNSKKQSSLNKENRKKNVENAYVIKDGSQVKNKKILLFDDIYTTGNTVNECSRILREAGAEQIGILTIAKD